MNAPLLLIPGPVQTDPRVKAAMAQDFAPWDNATRPRYAALRERIRCIAGGVEGVHVCIPLQGSGHFVLEAALRTFVSPGGKVLVPVNGDYGERLVRLARESGRIPVETHFPEGQPVTAEAVATALAADPEIGHVALVHSETSTALLNPVEAIAQAVRLSGRRLILDAVSSFGALPFDLASHPETDAVIFSANKCLAGMPGLGFAVARIDRLVVAEGQAGSWVLDLSDAYRHALQHGWGSIRFTASVQAIAAMEVAVAMFDEEGGQPALLARYAENVEVIRAGLLALGLDPWIPAALQGPIIVNMHQPADPRWQLLEFVERLKRKGFLISNFSATREPTLRVGCIGRLFPDTMREAVKAMGEVLDEMGIRERGRRRAAAA